MRVKGRASWGRRSVSGLRDRVRATKEMRQSRRKSVMVGRMRLKVEGRASRWGWQRVMAEGLRYNGGGAEEPIIVSIRLAEAMSHVASNTSLSQIKDCQINKP